MERKESLDELFFKLGVAVEDDAIIDKCLQLCDTYDTSLEKFVELWVAFCVEKLEGINPTLGSLLQMEEDMKKEHCDPCEKLVEPSMEDRPLLEYVDMNDVLSMYNGTDGESLKRKRTTSESDADAQPVKRVADSQTTCAEDLSTQAQPNTTEKDKILISLGKTIASWKRTEDNDVEVEQIQEPAHHVPSNIKYMYEILSKQGRILTNACRCMGNKLMKLWQSTAIGPNAHKSDVRYVKYVRSVSQTHFRTFGRINAKKESGNTVMLEGCTRKKGGLAAESIELDFRNVKNYSVFSGQIVAVEATNPIGDTLYVKDMFAKAYAPSAPAPRIRSRINIFVAAGSFTSSNNLQYEQLWNLMERVAIDEPHILILIGPFLDYTNSKVGTLKETYHRHFEKILTNIMRTAKKNTQVILVASNRDAHQEPVFPTPEYTIYNTKLLQECSNLRVMPDPCILDVEGLKIGVTSVDVIKHIGKEEISNISGMDRLGRLADHVLAQTCFYPVYPPSEELNVDTEMWDKYTFFDEQPHMLILPSDMRCYCKVINNCFTLNPERLHKHTYARLSVRPCLDNEWSSDNVSCDIVKV